MRREVTGPRALSSPPHSGAHVQLTKHKIFVKKDSVCSCLFVCAIPTSRLQYSRVYAGPGRKKRGITRRTMRRTRASPAGSGRQRAQRARSSSSSSRRAASSPRRGRARPAAPEPPPPRGRVPTRDDTERDSLATSERARERLFISSRTSHRSGCPDFPFLQGRMKGRREGRYLTATSHHYAANQLREVRFEGASRPRTRARTRSAQAPPGPRGTTAGT